MLKLVKKIIFIFFILSKSYAETLTYNYTGSAQTFTVPTGLISMTIELAGGEGGKGISVLRYNVGDNSAGPDGTVGGKGGRVQSTIDVDSLTAGQVLYIFVGQKGEDSAQNNQAAGGYGGNNDVSGGAGAGGVAVTSATNYAGSGGGGGATDVRLAGTALSNRIAVAGGGGGGQGNRGYSGDKVITRGGQGGHGGGTSGEAGRNGDYGGAIGGGGGTQSAAGAAGRTNQTPPAYGTAGSSASGGGESGDTIENCNGSGANQSCGGGGGGGYFGGGSGRGSPYGRNGSGGGGGSSYTNSTYVSGVTHTQGYREGNGYVIIVYSANSRSAYTIRVDNRSNLETVLNVLENINSNNSNSTLTSALDSLTDDKLITAVKQIKGTTIQSQIGQSIEINNTFSRALRSSTSAPSFNQLVQNNYANISTNEIKKFYNPNYELNNITNDFTIEDIAKIFSNKNLLSFGSNESSFFLRTFANIANQDEHNDLIGYETNTAGFVFGNQIKIDRIQSGWGIGFSTAGTDYDSGYGINNTNSLHASFFAKKNYDKFETDFSLGTFVSKINSTRNITEGVTQTLKSSKYDIGTDLNLGISKKINLNGWVLTPSVKLNGSYVIQDDINESGGDLALKINKDNLLQIKPEIGFNLNNEIFKNGHISQGLNFSIYGSEEKKLDGSDANATIKDTGNNYSLIDNRKTDKFITAGLGYLFENTKNKTNFLISAFSTQNDYGDMNSSLLVFDFTKKF